jgi:RNA polymerase sigma-70 factor (ECF subfamily)
VATTDTSAHERFGAFYEAEFATLAGYCFQLTRDRELAHDLAQEAFARVFGRWISVREPRGYLFHVATNLVRAAWRGRERDRSLLGHLKHDDRAAPDPDFAVRDAVERLPKRYRELVLLHYYADLTVPDVAAAVRRPEGSVKRMLNEARALLAGSLKDGHD